MLFRRSLTALIIIAVIAVLFACSSNKKESSEQEKAKIITASLTEESKTDVTLSDVTDFSGDIEKLAAKYGSTPSRAALALLICKLDETHSFSYLPKKSASDLFEQLMEAAVENNITLETLDKNYCLKDILKNENINVNFSSNNVVYQKSVSSETNKEGWIKKFEKAIRRPAIEAN